MAGILFAVLKFIGCLLLAIVLLLLLILAAVLFCPVKYEAEGGMKNSLEDIKCRLQVTWLFGGIRIRTALTEGELKGLSLKVLWFDLLNRKNKRKKKPAPKEEAAAEDNALDKAMEPIPTGGIYEAENRGKPPDEAPLPAEEMTAAGEEAEGRPPAMEKAAPRPRIRVVPLSEIEEKPYIPQGEILSEDKDDEGEEEYSEKLKTAELKKYWGKFKEIEDKKGIFRALKKLITRLIKGILPKDLFIRATVGLGSPDITGYFMGLAGILTAKFGDNIRIRADFTRLGAEDVYIRIKGRIVTGYFVYAMLAFVLNRPVRRLMIKLWRGRKNNG